MFFWLTRKILSWAIKRSDRNIFEYWDGIRFRRCDPIVVWKAIFESNEIDPAIDFRLATGVGADGKVSEYDPSAQNRVLAFIRKTFDVREWTEKTPGLTVDETLKLLWAYFDFATNLKKKQDPSPTPSPVTDSISSMGPSTTPPDLDSSSTKTESINDAPSSS